MPVNRIHMCSLHREYLERTEERRFAALLGVHWNCITLHTGYRRIQPFKTRDAVYTGVIVYGHTAHKTSRHAASCHFQDGRFFPDTMARVAAQLYARRTYPK